MQPHLNISSNGSVLSVHQNGTNLDEMIRNLNGGNLDSVFYNSLISLCISEKALQEGVLVHSHMASTGFKPSIFLENQFINLYAKCGEMGLAQELFDGMLRKNSVSWNAMIAGYCLNRQFREALHLFRRMTETGAPPNQSTYLSALRASVGSGNCRHGEQIHAHVIKMGFFLYTRVENALINMYAKLGNLEKAETVYERMVEKDEVSWNSIVNANAKKGYCERAMQLFAEMQQEGLRPDEFSFTSILRSSNATVIKELHAQIIKSGYGSHVFVATALLDSYSSGENLEEAFLIFSKMLDPNIVAWNTMISAFIKNEQVDEGLQLFLQMMEESIYPDDYTISTLLKAMTVRSTVLEGKQLHVLATKSGLASDALVGNSLITMYSKYGQVCDSRQAFDNISEPDLISWNSMIQSYAQNERAEQALLFFQDMKYSGIEPDELTFIGILTACTTLSRHETGRAIHGCLIKIGLLPDAFLGSALIDMYAKSGNVSDAKNLFDEIEQKDLITWNSMIVGFSQNGHGEQALDLLCLMLEENLEPDNTTFASLVSGCADITAVQQGKQVHALILKSRIITDVPVVNSLITMYASVGSIKEAEQVFYGLTAAKTIITWTAMIMGYAQNGCTKEALDLFDQMESYQVKPDSVTFVALLTACSHAGLTDQAKMYFNVMMTKYGITPNLGHYACMVDILGRAGKLEEAEDFINRMPHEPNALVWRTLLSACRTHGDLDRGKRSMEKILVLEPGDSAAYVLLSNIYAAQGKRDGVTKVRQQMRENGVRKEVGKSWIEVRNTVHEFAAGDHSHPRADDIYSKLRELLVEMELAGYVPNIDSVLYEIEYTKVNYLDSVNTYK
ncbi:hypothetical protein HHK36_004395 [Tetracentron sinense]|uniref:Pentatricopeptide repeat-containing protein n=1 Tax=Tetracentron sinense TaxID=13715 RepID=A0A834ZR35_TETSI|nr:hypothetical protein HHK36_004395 [Tetracentron sinense]